MALTTHGPSVSIQTPMLQAMDLVGLEVAAPEEAVWHVATSTHKFILRHTC